MTKEQKLVALRAASKVVADLRQTLSIEQRAYILNKLTLED